MSDNQTPIHHIWIENPPLADPWRTQGDYRVEQEEAQERHRMLQEQHAMLQKQHLILHRSFRANIVAVSAAVVAAIATCFLVYQTYLIMPSKQEPRATHTIQSQKEQEPTTKSTP